MARYLELTDAEWELIQPVLPVPKRGPKRSQDRTVCAAFLFARAAGVSLESLPIGFPDSQFLRTTWGRWSADGTLSRLFEVGGPACERMNRQYRNRIISLTLRERRVNPEKIGRRSVTMPRWSWVRGA